MSSHYDVIIIGGGNAGFAVSAAAHAAGKSIAFIESREFGGTCPNRGCTPKKVLVAAAHALHEINGASIHGIEVGPAKVNWSDLIDRTQGMIDFIPDAMRSTAEQRGTVYTGEATFIDEQTVEIEGQQISGDNIVIATGSKPRELPFAGAEHLVISDDVLSNRQQPKQVVFVGGGVIALEFAHVLRRAGSDVTILEVMPTLLPNLDADTVAVLRADAERLGIRFRTSANVTEISKHGDEYKVHVEHDGQALTINADRVINGAGRVANVDSLNLAAAGVKHDGVRIEIDDYLNSTTNKRVWVAGDALVQSAQLSPLATYEGSVVGHNIVNGPSRMPDYSVNPSAIYTVPALATVGLTEAAARDQGLDIEVTTNDMREWFSAKTYGETVAWSKIIVNRSDDTIVGAHLVGHKGEELIHLFSLAMQHAITASKLRTSRFAFPTFSHDIKNLM